jgi:hypothetical protein
MAIKNAFDVPYDASEELETHWGTFIQETLSGSAEGSVVAYDLFFKERERYFKRNYTAEKRQDL